MGFGLSATPRWGHRRTPRCPCSSPFEQTRWKRAGPGLPVIGSKGRCRRGPASSPGQSRTADPEVLPSQEMSRFPLATEDRVPVTVFFDKQYGTAPWSAQLVQRGFTEEKKKGGGGGAVFRAFFQRQSARRACVVVEGQGQRALRRASAEPRSGGKKKKKKKEGSRATVRSRITDRGILREVRVPDCLTVGPLRA